MRPLLKNLLFAKLEHELKNRKKNSEIFSNPEKAEKTFNPVRVPVK